MRAVCTHGSEGLGLGTEKLVLSEQEGGVVCLFLNAFMMGYLRAGRMFKSMDHLG